MDILPKISQFTSSHRSWAIPQRRWTYYQEWNRVLFLHWQVPPAIVHPHLPTGLAADRYNGNCYISLVAFTMEQIRPRFLPAVPLISNFDEINLRTYVTVNGRPGVYFLSIEAGRRVSSLLAKTLSGLPYTYSDLDRTEYTYRGNHPHKPFRIKASFHKGKMIPEAEKSELDIWLTERYALYLSESGRLYRFEIAHRPWPLFSTSFSSLEVDYSIGEMTLNKETVLSAHYSPGVHVLSWSRETL